MEYSKEALLAQTGLDRLRLGGLGQMKYQAIIKYCPVTASQKGWEHCLGEFETEKEAEEFFDENAERLLPPMARQFGFAQRMLFLIKKKKKKEEANED